MLRGSILPSQAPYYKQPRRWVWLRDGLTRRVKNFDG